MGEYWAGLKGSESSGRRESLSGPDSAEDPFGLRTGSARGASGGLRTGSARGASGGLRTGSARGVSGGLRTGLARGASGGLRTGSARGASGGDTGRISGRGREGGGVRKALQSRRIRAAGKPGKSRRQKQKKKGTAGIQPDGQEIFAGLNPARELTVFLVLDMFVSYLFFRSWIFALLLLPAFPFYLRERRRTVLAENEDRIRGEFLTGIQLFGTSLQAGYSAENAAAEALKELEKIYGQDTFIVREFRQLCARMELNVPIEKLFLGMAARSGVDDIESFAEVFAAARRSGGDLGAISRNTVSVIRMKEETRAAIATALSGKQMEQSMMSLIPLLILAYVGLTSDGLLTPMYTTAAGRVIMCACLAVYIAAFLWGRRITRIRV